MKIFRQVLCLLAVTGIAGCSGSAGRTTSFGRTRVWESILPGDDVHAAMVASQRLAFLGLARQLAKELVGGLDNPGSSTDGAAAGNGIAHPAGAGMDLNP